MIRIENCIFTYNNIGDYIMKKRIIDIFRIFFPLIVGSIVGIAINKYMDYNSLIKPLGSPPGWIFPVAWSIIYLLLGISYYIFKKNNSDEKITTIYYIQLFVNALWSFIFFVWKLRLLAVFWIILLDILVIWLFILFLKKEKTSAYLNILYIIWVFFATYLTIGIYILN